MGDVGNLSGLASGRRVIDGGAEHTCALAADGRAFCWGNGGAGELGANSIGTAQTPLQV